MTRFAVFEMHRDLMITLKVAHHTKSHINSQ